MFVADKILGAFNWVKQKFASWGGYSKQGRIVVVGLPNSGKQTIMLLLDKGGFERLPPVGKINQIVALFIGKIYVFTGSVGEGEGCWKRECVRLRGIVFVIDTADSGKFEESKREFWKIVNDQDFSDVAILILGNKIDKNKAASMEEIVDIFQIKRAQENKRPVKLFMITCKQKQGLEEGLLWLGNQIK